MSNALALLRAVMARLDRPEAWCQGAFAVDDQGCAVAIESGYVVATDLAGAAMLHARYGGPERLAEALRFKDALAMRNWNDAPDRTHADIIARLDEAIEREGK